MDEIQEQPIKVTTLYAKTWNALQDDKIRIIVHQGGSRSSKTVSIMQAFLTLSQTSPNSFLLNIARKFRSTITDTILRDFESETERLAIDINPEYLITRKDQRYFINNCEFNFLGLDDKQKAHGMPSDYAWLNEAIEIGREEFDQIEMRTRQKIVIDFNPSDDTSWIYDLVKRDDVIFIRSTMLDNPFLETAIRKKIQGYEPNPHNIEQGTADSYMWEVYGQGNKAKLEGAVFEDFEIIDSIPENAQYKGAGMDFGYTNDPTAIIDLWTLDNTVIYDELVYQTKLQNSDISKELKRLDFKISTNIWADSSEPKSIAEIQGDNFNVKAVTKGPDSIRNGINNMKAHKIYLTKRSVNLEREFRKYKWKEDKNGKSLNEPIDAFNHGIDAARYVTTMELHRKSGVIFYK